MDDLVDVNSVVVRLERHVGYRAIPGVGRVKQDTGQCRVFANDAHVGYIADDPNSHISLIVSGYPDELVSHIKSEVDRLRGIISPLIVQAQKVNEANVQVVDEPTDDQPIA